MKIFRTCILILGLTVPALAQQPASLSEWIRHRRTELTAAAVDSANTASKQTESPAATGGASLVDQSSASDFVSMALNFAGLSTGDGEAAKPKTVTATAYALLAAVRGFDPLDPTQYNQHRVWRRFSFTLGTVDQAETEASESGEGGEEGDDAGASETAKLYSVKYTTNDRDPRKAPSFVALTEAVKGIAAVEARLARRIPAYAFRRPQLVTAFLETATGAAPTEDDLGKFTELAVDQNGNLVLDGTMRTQLIQFSNFYFSSADGIKKFEEGLTDEDRDALDEIIRDSMKPYSDAEAEAQKVIDEVQAAPQFAFVATLKQPERANDTLVAEVVYDKGMWSRTTFTANAAYEWTESGGELEHSAIDWRFAAQLRWQLSSAMSGRSSFFDLATEGKLKPGKDDVYKAQAKLTLPLVAGMAMPISVTYANREELIDEADVRGELGFTIDFSKLSQAFTQMFLRRP